MTYFLKHVAVVVGLTLTAPLWAEPQDAKNLTFYGDKDNYAVEGDFTGIFDWTATGQVSFGSSEADFTLRSFKTGPKVITGTDSAMSGYTPYTTEAVSGSLGGAQVILQAEFRSMCQAERAPVVYKDDFPIASSYLWECAYSGKWTGVFYVTHNGHTVAIPLTLD